MALIGYDDIDFAQAAIVPLPSIRQPADLIGRTAVNVLDQELADPEMNHRHVLFPPELVIRESSRSYTERATTGPPHGVDNAQFQLRGINGADT